MHCHLKIIIRIILTGFILFSLNTKTFSQDEKHERNSIKVSVLSLVSNVKVSYERFIGKNSLLGFSYSRYYTFTKGNKFEPYFRYSFNGTGQDGWYIEGRLAFGCFLTTGSYSEIQEVYKIDYENNSYTLINSSIDSYIVEYEFQSRGASLNTGYRLFFNNNENTFFDINLGLQYFPYIETYKTESEVAFQDRHKIITYKIWGEQTDKMTQDKKYWTYLGAGAFLNVGISVGVIF
jgi:hypothetical protein